MTTKRKLIMATLAKQGTSILDDMAGLTGYPRKNLQGNLKACIVDGLVDKLKDDVTGLPAYKVSTKGQQWLKNNANSSVTTQAVSGDITTASAHCATSLASVSPGQAATVRGWKAIRAMPSRQMVPPKISQRVGATPSTRQSQSSATTT